MKAVQLTHYGAKHLRLVSDVVKPSAAGGKIVVQIIAASLNPFDNFVLSGMVRERMPISFPYTPGGDFAGVVSEIGDGVTGLKIGDEVYGTALSFSGGSGAFAEYALVSFKNLAFKPKNTTFAEAASLPLVGSSAVQALLEEIQLSSGQKILIHGGGGGIGSIAIQIAKSVGSYVVTTVSAKDSEFVKRLGADQVVEYHTEKFEEKVTDLDAVFDTIGGETLIRSFPVLKRGGVIVSMIGQPDPDLAQKYGVIALALMTKTNTDHLNKLRELVEAGQVKPQVDRVFPLAQVKEAFTHLTGGHPQGKVVLKIKDQRLDSSSLKKVS